MLLEKMGRYADARSTAAKALAQFDAQQADEAGVNALRAANPDDLIFVSAQTLQYLTPVDIAAGHRCSVS